MSVEKHFLDWLRRLSFNLKISQSVTSKCRADLLLTVICCCFSPSSPTCENMLQADLWVFSDFICHKLTAILWMWWGSVCITGCGVGVNDRQPCTSRWSTLSGPEMARSEDDILKPEPSPDQTQTSPQIERGLIQIHGQAGDLDCSDQLVLRLFWRILMNERRN